MDAITTLKNYPPEKAGQIYRQCCTAIRRKLWYAQHNYRGAWFYVYQECLQLERLYPALYVNAWQSVVGARIPDPLSQPFYARLEAQR